MLIEISSIKGNSGAGSPVFSKPGLMHNTMYMAFNKESMPRKVPPEEQPFDYKKWKNDLAEIANKQKFHKQLARFEKIKKKDETLERMVKQGLSKSQAPKEGNEESTARKKPANVVLIGDAKKDKLKNSLGMSNEERDKLVAREKEMSRNRGACMSEIQVPGPGSYKPKYTQIDPKSDRVSHSLQAQDRRTTYFDRILNKQKDINEIEVMAELGCCDRVMRNLSAINQMTELKPPGEMQIEQPTMMMGRMNTIDAKAIFDKRLKEFMQQQTAETGLFKPSNTQYQRLVQKVNKNLNATQYSPHSERNLQLKTMQVFGSSGQNDNYSPKRETTLGYFSVKQPFETGHDCHRFVTRTLRAQQAAEKTSNKAARLKSELKEGRGESDPSEHEEKSVSNYESQPMTQMRATEYSSPSRGAWRGRMGSIPAIDGIRKFTSSNQLDHVQESISAIEKARLYSHLNTNKRRTEVIQDQGQSPQSQQRQSPHLQSKDLSAQSQARSDAVQKEIKFRKSQVSFNEETAQIKNALNSNSELTNKASVESGPPVMTKNVSADPQVGERKSLSKIPTNKLVDEIAEVINDESPNMQKAKNERNTQHMGFQPADAMQSKNFTFNEMSAAQSSNGGGLPPFDRTHSVSLDDSPQPVNIVYNKKEHMFGVTCMNTTAANSNTMNTFRGSGSFMVSSNQISITSFMGRDLSVTNYESALEWGKVGLALGTPHSYQKTLKSPEIYYKSTRPGPIVLNEFEPVVDRALLPLVSHPGAFASKLRWDDKGTFRIKKSKTPRFAADSYLGEKPYLREQPSPRPIIDPNHTFSRSPSHVFPGLKKALDPVYIEDKESLFKKIIQGKEKVSSFRDLLADKRKLQNEKATSKIRMKKPSSVDCRL